MAREEIVCLNCGHSFPSEESLAEARCPRCDSELLSRNPWLLGSCEAEGLTAEDYRERVRVST
ncbi:MAG: hypothetical protein EXR49_01745 [Dehalococcoidia bacterium]|nr:hypothetical protein [Dehalococcoidia bacterium]